MSFGPQVYFSVAGPLAIAPDSDARTDLNPQNTRLRNAWFSGTVTAATFVGALGPGSSVPASLVTAGTFGAGNYLFPNDVSVGGVSSTYTLSCGPNSGATDSSIFQAGVGGVSNGLTIAYAAGTGKITYTLDTGNVSIPAGQLAVSGLLTASAGAALGTAKSIAISSTNGLINLTNAAATGFTRLTLGLETNAFPSLKVNGAAVQARLGDDSDYTDVQGGNYAASKLGAGLQVKAGANGRIGTATLVAGTVTVANTSVTANTIILLTVKTDGGTVGNLSWTVIAGTSFTITSSSAVDTSTVVWMLVETL